jgi:hypothetical protein
MFCTAPGQELAISDPSALTKGQPVTWKTTTSGTTPETLQGEYVGKLTNGLGNDANGKPRDLLLVKLDGPVVNGESKTLPAGVWAGASGSPVYDADGALIGAVSYGFSDEADNVAGVTPASQAGPRHLRRVRRPAGCRLRGFGQEVRWPSQGRGCRWRGHQ